MYFLIDLQPTKKTSKLVSIEQVPFTMMRLFLPKYYKEGVIVDMQELPIVLSEHAIDVNVSILHSYITISWKAITHYWRE